MQRTTLAPELSATLSLDSCWITVVPSCRLRGTPPGPRGSPGPLDHFDHPPPLEGGERAGLLDPHPVALLQVVHLVVGVELRGALQRLLVPGVPDPLHHGHDDGLVHLGGDDGALPDLPAVHTGRCLAHERPSASAAAISRSRRIVLMRAMSRRTWPRRAE